MILTLILAKRVSTISAKYGQYENISKVAVIVVWKAKTTDDEEQSAKWPNTVYQQSGCCHLEQQRRQPTSLSDYKLSDTEQFVLSHGLLFCLLPTSVKHEKVPADFEVLYVQLVHHKPQYEEQLAALKARLSDLAHTYCGSPIDLGDFLMTKECFQAIKSLWTNEEILITKPDKGAGIVILNKNDYNDKMKTILNDTTQFLDLGPVTNKDNTAKIELWIQ